MLSEPADIVLHDELNFSRPDVLRLYEDRIAHSELAWRRERNEELAGANKFDLPAWDSLKIYDGGK